MTTETGAPAADQTAAPAIQGEELTIEQAMSMIESGAVDQRVEEDGSVSKQSTDNTRKPAERAQPATAEHIRRWRVLPEPCRSPQDRSRSPPRHNDAPVHRMLE